MNNVIFFAPNTGQPPTLWATKEVSGSYTGSPNPVDNTYQLTGSGLSVDFTFKAWDTTNNKWGATISGGGTYSNSGQTMHGMTINIKGAAAGSIDSSQNKFSGTAAGIVTRATP